MFNRFVDRKSIISHLNIILNQVCQFIERCRSQTSTVEQQDFQTVLDFDTNSLAAHSLKKHGKHIAVRYLDTILKRSSVGSINQQNLGSSITYWMKYVAYKLESCIFGTSNRTAGYYTTPSTATIEPCKHDFNYEKFMKGMFIACMMFVGLYTVKIIVNRITFLYRTRTISTVNTETKSENIYVKPSRISKNNNSNHFHNGNEEEQHVDENLNVSSDINISQLSQGNSTQVDL